MPSKSSVTTKWYLNWGISKCTFCVLLWVGLAFVCSYNYDCEYTHSTLDLDVNQCARHNERIVHWELERVIIERDCSRNVRMAEGEYGMNEENLLAGIIWINVNFMTQTRPYIDTRITSTDASIALAMYASDQCCVVPGTWHEHDIAISCLAPQAIRMLTTAKQTIFFFSFSTLVDAMRAISRLNLSFAVLFQWRVTVGYIPENVVPMGTKSTIMENQLRTIYKIYDWFEVIRPDRRENGRIGKTLHVSEYFHLHHIRLIRSHSVIDLAQKTQRQNVCRGFCWIFFPCPLFCLTCCIRTHEKCQHTRGDRINIENGVEHEQTNHVSWAHMCSKQPRVCGGGGDNQSDNSGERSRFSILDICIATNREIGKCRVKTSIWNERENFVVGIVFVRISSTSLVCIGHKTITESTA